MTRPSFLIDVMLQKLGRWLRILGIRAEDPEDHDDAAILFQAKSKGLTLLTMDKELAAKAARLKIKSLHIPPTMIDITDQLSLLARKFRLPIKGWEERTLCTKCGGELDVVSSESVAGRIPPGVLRRFKDVWQCTVCGHIYWMGSHWERIGETVGRVKKKLRQRRKS